jgi:hypothetical protein
LVGYGAEVVGPDDEGVTTRVNLPLLDLGLEPMLDTPTSIDTPTLIDTQALELPTMMETASTESILGRFLESNTIIDIDDTHRWNEDLEDLFPDLV